MKGKHSNSLVARLNRLKTDLEAIGNPESRAAFLRELDDLIARLRDVRTQLTSAPLETRLSQIQSPLGQVIEFLEFAKADTSLAPLIFDALNHKTAKPKRLPVDIPA